MTGGSSAGGTRDTKLGLLIAAESAELAMEAAKEACLLAPGSMYLGGNALARLADQFQDIARQMRSDENALSHRAGGASRMYYPRGTKEADGGLVGREFDAYKEIIEAAVAAEGERGAGGGMSCPLSREEVERLERMRDIVQQSASRVVGRAIAHQALETALESAVIVAAV